MFDRYVAPNSWENKVEIIRQFIDRCGIELSSSIRRHQPERTGAEGGVRGLLRTAARLDSRDKDTITRIHVSFFNILQQHPFVMRRLRPRTG